MPASTAAVVNERSHLRPSLQVYSVAQPGDTTTGLGHLKTRRSGQGSATTTRALGVAEDNRGPVDRLQTFIVFHLLPRKRLAVRIPWITVEKAIAYQAPLIPMPNMITRA